jgi:hypothetical protein
MWTRWQVSGEYRTGKTQLAHTLCVTAQLGAEQYVEPRPLGEGSAGAWRDAGLSPLFRPGSLCLHHALLCLSLPE